jgi:CheY-like chemotaxis protein
VWQGRRGVREILKTNNPVELNYAQVVLKDAGIDAVVFDANMSVMDGSMVILPQRLMVQNEDETRAIALLKEAFAAPSPLT